VSSKAHPSGNLTMLATTRVEAGCQYGDKLLDLISENPKFANSSINRL
jgi:hypothetical protein